MTTMTATDQHGVFVTTATGDKRRLTDPLTWDAAQHEWLQLDDDRRAGRYPHIRYFEVRSMGDPGYRDLPVMCLGVVKVLPGSRGTTLGRAARRAWRLWQGDLTPHGSTQGTGGWFYYRNGRTAAQGVGDGYRQPDGTYRCRGTLAELCERRGLIVQGQDGKWYVVEHETL